MAAPTNAVNTVCRPVRPHSRMLLALSGLIFLGACTKPVEKVEEIRPVRAIRIEAAPVDHMAEFSGEVRPRIESRLGFRVGGKIVAREVDVGSIVKRGQVLMRLDPKDLQLAQAQAAASMRAAASNRDVARADLMRYRQLRDKNFVSQALLDARKTAYEAAQASYDQARAAYRNQSNQAGYATLVADVDGVVTGVDAEAGQVVAAGSPVVRVARTDAKEVVIGIPEDKVDTLRNIPDVQVRTWAHPGEILPGTLRELSPVADPATRTYQAKIAIPDTADVKLGMTAYVTFIAGSQAPMVKLPLTALLQHKSGTAVWVVDHGTVKMAPIQVAGTAGNQIVVAGGVTPGQTVVTAGVNLLRDGQKVKILGADAAAERASEVAANAGPDTDGAAK